jgi:hypothetical protein
MLPTEIEDFLCYNVNPNYGYLKLHFAEFNGEKNILTANYLYTGDIEDIIAKLKPELEKMFKTAVGLPIEYKFVYNRAYIDETILRLKFTEYLRTAFTIMSGEVTDEDIKIEPTSNGFDINLSLSQQFADYLSGAKSFANFKETLFNDNFCEFNF